MEQDIKSFFNNIFEKYKEVSDNLNSPTPPITFLDSKQIIALYTKNQLDIIVKNVITGAFIEVSNGYSKKLSELCDKSRSDCKSYIIDNIDLSKYFEQNTDKIFTGITEILHQFFTLIYQFNITTNHFIYQRYTLINTNVTGLHELCEYCNLFLLDYSIIDNISYYEKLYKLGKRKDFWHFKEPFNNLNIFEFKLSFLKYKWLKRQKYNNSKLKQFITETYSEKYVFNNHIIDLDQKIKIGEPYYQTYKEWIEKIDYQYFDDRSEFDFVDCAIEKKEDLDTYDLYLQVKFHKDIEPNINNLKKLEDFFKDVNIANFPKNSKQKNILYYYNNLFSAIVSSNENKESDVDAKFVEISNYYKNKKNNNFFLYYKYLDYKIRKCEEKIKRKEYNEVNIDYLKELLFICNSHFEWCKNGFNRLYDFDKKNSTVLIEGLAVYHASSFSLPMSISENEQILSKLEGDLVKLENSLYQGKSTYFIEDFQEELRKSEKKSIEIISLFTAVISFIVGTVASYQFIKSITQGIIFLIVFGISISVFLILIFIATRGVKLFIEIKKYWYLFIVPYLIAGIILFFLFDFYKKNESPESANNLNTRIDLLIHKNKIFQNQLDSIKKAPLLKIKSDAKVNSKTNGK